mmetsp:Transcript_2190/g.6152  ORF Transcript_2190/g.6152 Transcript_2190/m.6152 type:complete len:223 (-) Transcript_2190:1532-2200(-)
MRTSATSSAPPLRGVLSVPCVRAEERESTRPPWETRNPSGTRVPVCTSREMPSRRQNSAAVASLKWRAEGRARTLPSPGLCAAASVCERAPGQAPGLRGGPHAACPPPACGAGLLMRASTSAAGCTRAGAREPLGDAGADAACPWARPAASSRSHRPHAPAPTPPASTSTSPPTSAALGRQPNAPSTTRAQLSPWRASALPKTARAQARASIPASPGAARAS